MTEIDLTRAYDLATVSKELPEHIARLITETAKAPLKLPSVERESFLISHGPRQEQPAQIFPQITFFQPRI